MSIANAMGSQEHYNEFLAGITDAILPVLSAAITEARAEGWDEGQRAQHDFARGFRGITAPVNPYRTPKETPDD